MITALASRLSAHPILAPLTGIVVSGGLLGGAWAFQLWGGLAPCELCLWQRGPHYAVLVVALVTVSFAGRLSRTGLVVLTALIGLGWLASAAIAGFHVGVEQHWWEGLQACGGGGIDAGANFEDLKAAILSAPVIRCDEVPWSLFGISLAGYNLLASLAGGLIALAVATRLTRRPEPTI